MASLPVPEKPVLKNLAIGVVLVGAVVVAIVAIATMDPTGARGARTGHRYVEGVRAAATAGVTDVAWEESATFAVPMELPRAIALDANDRMHVIGDRLVILAADGAVALRSDELTGDYRTIAIDAAGRVFVASFTAVDVLDLSSGVPVVESHRQIPGEGVELTGIALTPEGLFVADAVECRVLRLPLDGPLPAADSDLEVFAAGFFVPSRMELTATPDGDVVTVDPGRHQVQVRDGYGDVVRSFGKMGEGLTDFHGCCNPANIAVLPDGRTVTAEKGLAATRVKIYDRQGQFEGAIAGPGVFDYRPDGPPIILDVAVDSRGRVLVLDPSRRQVRVFTPKANEPGKGK